MTVGPHAKKSHKRAVANRRSAFALGVVRPPMSTQLPQVDGYVAWGYSGQLTGEDCALLPLRQILIGVATSGRGFRPVQDTGSDRAYRRDFRTSALVPGPGGGMTTLIL
jgi:hypothetical protein